MYRSMETLKLLPSFGSLVRSSYYSLVNCRGYEFLGAFTGAKLKFEMLSKLKTLKLEEVSSMCVILW